MAVEVATQMHDTTHEKKKSKKHRREEAKAGGLYVACIRLSLGVNPGDALQMM